MVLYIYYTSGVRFIDAVDAAHPQNFKYLDYFLNIQCRLQNFKNIYKFSNYFPYFKCFHKNIFCFEKYIGSRNEIKFLHSFKGQLK